MAAWVTSPQRPFMESIMSVAARVVGTLVNREEEEEEEEGGGGGGEEEEEEEETTWSVWRSLTFLVTLSEK